MSFFKKWEESKSGITKYIDKMDKTQAEGNSVNIVNINCKPKKQTSEYFVNTVNKNRSICPDDIQNSKFTKYIDKMDNNLPENNIVNVNGKPDYLDNSLEDLLHRVGASIIHENSSQVLRFNPELAGPKVDPERWEKALELEDLFFRFNA